MIQVTFTGELLPRNRKFLLTRGMFNRALEPKECSGLIGAMQMYVDMGGNINYAALLTKGGSLDDHVLREDPLAKIGWFKERYGIKLEEV